MFDWFASFFSLSTLEAVLNTLGYPAVTLFILIESAGIPLPGESIVLLASFYGATNGRLQLPIIIVCAAFGAIIGDNIGYLIGRTGGRKFVERFGRFFFVKVEHLDKAEKFFARHGAKTVFFGRFVSLLRIWAAFLAGVNKMHWRTFLFYNGLGGIVWATYVALLGYLAGHVFHEHFDQVEHLVHTIGWVGLALVGLLILGVVVLYYVRRARNRQKAQIARSEVVGDDETVGEGEKAERV
jgi:membrane protein DedA with SNARE-associated domain